MKVDEYIQSVIAENGLVDCKGEKCEGCKLRTKTAIENNTEQNYYDVCDLVNEIEKVIKKNFDKPKED